jgi:hypothetical protein
MPTEFNRIEQLIAQTNQVVNYLCSAPSSGSDVLYVDASVPPGNTVTGSVETAFESSYVIPANLVQVGNVLVLTTYGVYSIGAGTHSVDVRCYIGSTKVLDTSAVIVVGAFGNYGWTFDGTFFVTSVGTSGTMEVQGESAFDTNAQTSVVVSRNIAPFTIDTTVNQLMKMTWQFTS